MKFFMKQEKIEKENGTFVKHFCPRCGKFVVDTSEDYLYKKDGTPSKRAFDYLIWNFEDHIENDECKEFLQMTPSKKKNIKEFGSATVKGIVCNKCGETLPEILAVDHLDPDFPVNKCPHTPIYKIKTKG